MSDPVRNPGCPLMGVPDRLPYEYRPILDADMVAELLFLASGREALKMAREQRLPSVRVGKRVLFLRDEVLRYLAEQSRQAISDEDIERGRI